MNVSRSRDKTCYISVRTCQAHSIIRNFQSYLATGSAKIPYIVQCMCKNLKTRSNIDEKTLEHGRGFELFVYRIFPEIISKKLQPQENYPKHKYWKLSVGTWVRARKATIWIQIQSRKYPRELSLFRKEDWLTLTPSPFCLSSFFLTRL